MREEPRRKAGLQHTTVALVQYKHDKLMDASIQVLHDATIFNPLTFHIRLIQSTMLRKETLRLQSLHIRLIWSTMPQIMEC